jgi:hypothetical protein
LLLADILDAVRRITFWRATMARKRKRPDPEWEAARERMLQTIEQARALVARGEAQVAARRAAEREARSE